MPNDGEIAVKYRKKNNPLKSYNMKPICININIFIRQGNLINSPQLSLV